MVRNSSVPGSGTGKPCQRNVQIKRIEFYSREFEKSASFMQRKPKLVNDGWPEPKGVKLMISR